MHREIERKFLVKSGRWKQAAVRRFHIKQAYLSFGPPVTVRVRDKDGQGMLTVKGESHDGGISRREWEKKITMEDTGILFQLAQGRIIEKIRYEIPWEDVIIEVDEFIRPRKGLVLAEIELKDENQPLNLPDWLGEEVTGKKEYYNAYMAQYG